MSADSLYYLNLAAQFALVLLGVALALLETWPKRHPWIVLGIFALVGSVAMFAAVRQGQENTRQNSETQRRADEATAKLASNMDRLGTQAGEISRIQGLNTDLQNKLVESSSKLLRSNQQIFELSKEGINAVTGGDTFCVFVADPTNNSSGSYPLTVWVYGKYPMNNVVAQLQTIGDNTLPYFHDIPLGYGTLLPGVHPVNFRVTLGKYIITIWSRRGLLSESLELKPLDGTHAAQTIDVSGDGKNLFSLSGNMVKVKTK